MITNVKITLDDEQRKLLAQRMGNTRLSKTSLVTREEINLIARKCIQALLSERDPDSSHRMPTAGDDWFDDYLAETCRGAVFGGQS